MTKQRFAALLTLFIGIAATTSVVAGPTFSAISIDPVAAATDPGGSATYTITVSRVGSGNLDVYLSISNLPAGITASFLPTMVHFTGPIPTSLTAGLTLSTSRSLPMGIYNFTVTGDDGSSHNKKTTNGMLLVGVGMSCVEMLPDHSAEIIGSGVAGQTYIIQATTNLIAPVWLNISTNTAGSNSIYSFIDSDAKTCPCRFYRTLTTL
jgi:hypothetical protein